MGPGFGNNIATEPGWITTSPWGDVEFWPASEWSMADETDNGEGWTHWLERRWDEHAPLYEFTCGYAVATAKFVNGVLMVTPGWQDIPEQVA